MGKVKFMVALAVSAALAGCAPSPDAIAPAPIAAGLYGGLTCDQAGLGRVVLQRQLTALEVAQRQAVTGDAISVFLVAVPLSAVTGSNKAGAIAQIKGQLIALDARLAGC